MLQLRSKQMKGRDREGSALPLLRRQRRPGLRRGGPSGAGTAAGSGEGCWRRVAAQGGAAAPAAGSARGLDRARSCAAGRIGDATAAPVLQLVAGKRVDVVLNLVRSSPEETAQLAGLGAAAGPCVSTTTPGP